MTDTPDNRGSAINVGPGTVLPTPDGEIDQADRAQLAGAYRGFLYGAAAELAEVMGDLIVFAMPRNLTVQVRPATGGRAS